MFTSCLTKYVRGSETAGRGPDQQRADQAERQHRREQRPVQVAQRGTAGHRPLQQGARHRGGRARPAVPAASLRRYRGQPAVGARAAPAHGTSSPKARRAANRTHRFFPPDAGRLDDLALLVDVRQGGHPAAGQRRLAALQPVDPVPDLLHRGRGDVGAEPGVRDHHEHDVLRVVARGERGEHRGGLRAVGLGGTGLAGHAHLVERETGERAGGRAGRHHALQGGPDVGQGALRHRKVAHDRRGDLLHDLAVGRQQRLAHPRAVQRAAVGERGVGVGQLQRGDLHVALADGGDHRLAGRPDVAGLAVVPFDLLDVAAVLPAVLAPVLAGVGVVLPEVVQPLPGRDRAVALLRQVDAGVLAEAPAELHLLHLLDRRVRAGHVVGRAAVLDPGVVGKVVEHGVAGLHEGLVEAHRALVRVAVVGEGVAVDRHRGRAVVLAVQRVTGRDRGRGRRHLPGRAG